MAASAAEEDTSSAGARAGAATVKVQLKAAPGTPLMKVAKFRAPADQPFAFVRAPRAPGGLWRRGIHRAIFLCLFLD